MSCDRARQRAVVGERDGRHLELGRPRDQVGDPAGAVEDRVLGVDVQVDERRLGHAEGTVYDRPRTALSGELRRAPEGPPVPPERRAQKRAAAPRKRRWAPRSRISAISATACSSSASVVKKCGPSRIPAPGRKSQIDLTLAERALDRLEVGDVQGHGAAASLRLARGAQLESGVVGRARSGAAVWRSELARMRSTPTSSIRS